ncbi:MAG: hypothetical protein ACO1SV_06520 [Fimbriimonas sp.]
MLRYCAPSAGGKDLTIEFGVLLSAEDRDLVEIRLNRSTARLVSKFGDAPAAQHRIVVRALEQEVRELQKRYAHGQGSLFPLGTAGEVIEALWKDVGPHYRFSPTGNGEAEDVSQALDELYSRFVSKRTSRRSPRPPRPVRKTDEDVWRDVEKRLPVPVAMRLRPASIEAGSSIYHFKHAYENGRLHVVEPISFDLPDPERLREKSVEWVDFARELSRHLGTLSFVVTGPSAPAAQSAYRSALKALDRVAHVYEVDQAEKLADRLSRLMS